MATKVSPCLHVRPYTTTPWNAQSVSSCSAKIECGSYLILALSRKAIIRIIFGVWIFRAVVVRQEWQRQKTNGTKRENRNECKWKIECIQLSFSKRMYYLYRSNICLEEHILTAEIFLLGWQSLLMMAYFEVKIIWKPPTGNILCQSNHLRLIHMY